MVPSADSPGSSELRRSQPNSTPSPRTKPSPRVRRSGSGDGRRGAAGAAAAGSVATSARPNLSAEENRSAGDFDSALATAFSTASGTVSRNDRTGRGVSVNRRAIACCGVGPVNGGSPASISNSTAGERVDVAARVERAGAGRLLRAHVGRRAERGAGLGDALARRWGRPASARAMPKSATSAWSPVSRMFSGLMSRWITPVAVGVLEGLRAFARDADRVLDRELLLALEPAAKRLPLDERHREPELAGRLRRCRARSGCGDAGAGR